MMNTEDILLPQTNLLKAYQFCRVTIPLPIIPVLAHNHPVAHRLQAYQLMARNSITPVPQSIFRA